MAILARTRYDYDGDLLQVRRSDLSAPGSFVHGEVTTDPGHYHVHTIEGRTAREREALAHRFHAEMSRIPGFILLAILPHDIVGGTPGTMAPAGYNRYTARMVYAIEAPQKHRPHMIRARQAS